MTAIRQALIEQSPSLELQRSAHVLISQLDAQVEAKSTTIIRLTAKLAAANTALRDVATAAQVDTDTLDHIGDVLTLTALP